MCTTALMRVVEFLNNCQGFNLGRCIDPGNNWSTISALLTLSILFANLDKSPSPGLTPQMDQGHLNFGILLQCQRQGPRPSIRVVISDFPEANSVKIVCEPSLQNPAKKIGETECNRKLTFFSTWIPILIKHNRNFLWTSKKVHKSGGVAMDRGGGGGGGGY